MSKMRNLKLVGPPFRAWATLVAVHRQVDVTVQVHVERAEAAISRAARRLYHQDDGEYYETHMLLSFQIGHGLLQCERQSGLKKNATNYGYV